MGLTNTLVHRLRCATVECMADPADAEAVVKLCHEAANEIERLEKARAGAEEAIRFFAKAAHEPEGRK